MATERATSFFASLEGRVRTVDSLLCVGLDPHVADLADDTPECAFDFCVKIIQATHPYAAAFKPNAAFFERFGAPGVEVLKRVIAAIPEGIPALLDGKRGDISTTAEAYASAAYDDLGAHAVTVNAYMGMDAITPFARQGKGIFVLCKTSNSSSTELQSLQVVGSTSGSGGPRPQERLFEHVAALAASEWASKGAELGLVVGATDIEALSAVRAVAPHTWILAPGVGFQGGDLAASLRAALRSDGMGVLVPVSRGISRESDPASAALKLRDAINAVRLDVASRTLPVGTTSTGTGTGSSAATAQPRLGPHQVAFISAALSASVLRFGSFTLKSGRVSPYFFNAGNFSSGGSLAALGHTYAVAIKESDIGFDVLFGPAYKGIPLVTATGMCMATSCGMDVPVAYNRKEAKDHGEGGTMVGADVKGKRVLIIDDVITAGTAVGEAVGIITAAGGVPAGVVIGLDRQERGLSDTPLSAVQQVQATYNIPVIAVVGLSDLLAYLRDQAATGTTVAGVPDLSALLSAISAYRDEYGVA